MKRMSLERIAGVTAGMLFLSAGCAVDGSFVAPAIDYDDDWIDPVTVAASTDVAWWRSFDDPVLESLVQTAQENNRDLLIALERIVEARAVRDAAGGRLFPRLDAAASVNRRRLSENGALPAGRIPGLDVQQTIYAAGFDAEWELDVFGAIRHRLHSAEASVDVMRAHAMDLSLTVSAEVARNYFELRSLVQERIAARQRRDAAAALAAFQERRMRAGDTTAAAPAQANAVLARAEALLPVLDASIRARRLAISLLTGSAPSADAGWIDESLPLPALRKPAFGGRRDVLAMRPDVVAAERRLAAAAAEQGAATATLLPRIGLAAAGGFEALDTGTLFDSASRTWSVLPRISWSVFDSGARRAEVAASASRTRQAALGYERAVLTALADIETKRATYDGAVERFERQQSLQQATRIEFETLERRYAAGDVSKSALLGAEMTLRDAEQALAAARGDAVVGLVALYKALGGWAADGEALVSL